MLEKEKVAVLSSFSEKIVETKVCKHCGCQFNITDKDLEFYEKVSPIFTMQNSKCKIERKWIKDLWNWKIKYLIPAPTFCPDCRQQRRLSFRNERKLYKRKCDFSWKEIVSIYSPNKTCKVYDQKIWRSDKWDAMDYGFDFDFSKSFFEQFSKLLELVPIPNMFWHSLENSEYSLYSKNIKDCYQVVSTLDWEDLLYGYQWHWSKLCMDFSFTIESEKCYETIDCLSCKDCIFSIKCKSSNNLSFCYSCESCLNCILCYNLVNKSYCIGDKQYTKEEYEIEKIKYIWENILSTKVTFDKLLVNIIRKSSDLLNSHNCIGNFLNYCNNCKVCFDLTNSENTKYCFMWINLKDSMDSNFSSWELCYDSLSPVFWFKTLFSVFWRNCSNSLFMYICQWCKNCFWCVWLKNKSYCILNKQYTKEEYNSLVPKIIEHMQKTWEWWEFFPSSLSPFWYNETVAEEYFPIEINTGLNKKDIKYIDREWNTYKNLKEAWERPVFKYSSYESPKPNVEKIIAANKLPESIADIPDDILNWAIECEVTKKPFRIIKQELDFYRKHNLPIPRRHPDQRHLDRMKLRNPRKLYDRLCDCEKCEENNKKAWTFKQEDFALKDPESFILRSTTENESSVWQRRKIKTTYAPERAEIVYCEECYNRELY